MFRHIGKNLADGIIEIEKQGALFIASHHTLDPEECGDAHTVRDGQDLMQTAAGIEYEIAGRQFHAVRAERVFDDEFATGIVFGRAEK